MVFDIITIFPELFTPFSEEGLLAKAKEKGLLEIRAHNLRKWSERVDDKPFGGGIGMVMLAEPILKAVNEIKREKSRVILFGPRGAKFTQSTVRRLSKYEQLVMICGRYEGVDERVSLNIADEEISIGDYVLMGGELPAMVVIEAISRLIPGVIGKDEFLTERVDGCQAVEYPQFTRPASLPGGDEWKVPEVLLSGNHKEIEEWRESHKKKFS